MHDLQGLVDDYFASTHRTNPPLDAQALFNDFLDRVQQSQDQDLSRFDEEDWRKVLPEFGIDDPDEMIAALENLASWGVVDNYVWETETERDVEREIEE